MGDESGLRRLVVVRGDGEDRVGAHLLGDTHGLDALGVSLLPAPATMTARSPTAPMTTRRRSSFSAAVVVGDFRRPGHDDAVVALVDQVRRQPLRGVQVD